MRPFSLSAILALALGTAPLLAAQAPPAAASATPPAHPAHKPPHARKRVAAAHPQPPAPQPEPTPVAPPTPPPPAWPANEQPAPASVTWDSQGLHIEAANSSLAQILTDVADATGAKVEGLQNDERVFGAYGPAPAREVLSQLLLGSGYNIVMIGDQGQGTPREIVLSPRRSGGAQPPAVSAMQSGEEETEPEEPPQPTQQPIQHISRHGHGIAPSSRSDPQEIQQPPGPPPN